MVVTLTSLTKATVPWVWTENQQFAFEWLVQLITSSPVMAHPETNKPYVLFTDACSTGFGACLCQEGEKGKYRPIHYASCRTTEAQSRLPAIRLEAQAILWAVRHFHYYLDGRKVTVFTDSLPLVQIFRAPAADAPRPKGKYGIAHESILLQAYDLDVKHTPGVLNGCADALSRVCEDSGLGKMTADTLLCALVGVSHFELMHRSLFEYRTIEELKERQIADVEIRDMYMYLLREQVPENRQRRRMVVSSADKFILRQGVVCRRLGNVIVPVVPLAWRFSMVEKAHIALGHFGAKKIFDFVKDKVWWMGLYADIKAYIASCITCAKWNDGPVVHPGLKPTTVSHPFQRVEVDVVKLPKSKNGYQCMLCFVDCFTRWMEAVPLKKEPTAKQVLMCLQSEIIARHGVPDVVQSDNALNLENAAVHVAAEKFRFVKFTSTTYTPRSQGAIERSQKTLTRVLRKWCDEFPSASWDELLPAALLAYRVTVHQSTQQTPFFLLYGRDVRLPFGVSGRGEEIEIKSVKDLERYAKELAKRTMEVWDLASQKSCATQQQNRRSFRDKRAKMPDIKLGDWVMIYLPSVAKNSGDAWRSGPFVVVEVTDTSAVVKEVHMDCPDSGCDKCLELFQIALHRLKRVKRPTRK